jgi:hypothetical protein
LTLAPANLPLSARARTMARLDRDRPAMDKRNMAIEGL